MLSFRMEDMDIKTSFYSLNMLLTRRNKPKAISRGVRTLICSHSRYLLGSRFPQISTPLIPTKSEFFFRLFEKASCEKRLGFLYDFFLSLEPFINSFYQIGAEVGNILFETSTISVYAWEYFRNTNVKCNVKPTEVST